MSKKDIKKLNTRSKSKKLNRNKSLIWNLKSGNKVLKYKLTENLENVEEQATRLQKCIVENGTLKKSFLIRKQKLESWKLQVDKAKKKRKKDEYDPSFLLKLEDLKEQVKFLENEKLLLKEPLNNFKKNKIQLFKKCQYSNSICAAY